MPTDGRGKRWNELEAPVIPTPHEAYVENVTPRTIERFTSAFLGQAIKDYIKAYSTLENNPKDMMSLCVMHECEDVFEMAGRLETVRHKMKYDCGMFRVMCMDNYPHTWAEEQPRERDKRIHCPICKEGRISRIFYPRSKDPEDIFYNKAQMRAAVPHIVFQCDTCAYKYVSYPWSREDVAMKKTKDAMKITAMSERERLFREEMREWFSKQDNPKQEEVDAAYRKLALKWGV